MRDVFEFKDRLQSGTLSVFRQRGTGPIQVPAADRRRVLLAPGTRPNIFFGSLVSVEFEPT